MGSSRRRVLPWSWEAPADSLPGRLGLIPSGLPPFPPLRPPSPQEEEATAHLARRVLRRKNPSAMAQLPAPVLVTACCRRDSRLRRFSSSPLAPRARTAEEIERSSRGFGFSSYGNSGARRIDDGSGARSSGDEARRNSLNRDLAPSRADEVDDWGSTKRSVAAPDRRERGVGLFDSHSRADEVDDWISKKTTASRFIDGTRKIDGGGLDGLREKKGSFEMFRRRGLLMSGADGETWGKKKEEVGRGDWILGVGGGKNLAGRFKYMGRKEEVQGNGGGVGRPRLVFVALVRCHWTMEMVLLMGSAEGRECSLVTGQRYQIHLEPPRPEKKCWLKRAGLEEA
ncbi:hypothetical protein HPP92_022329 [Vanilla planifolia]|uniref:Uncharacterized protein n=1 Tax=Vanilla planifolia TaxID=51239 RepID=A0A835PS03_VANPL|nr:hypothetical protein HPP92_022329 [Vanilla planifolia]